MACFGCSRKYGFFCKEFGCGNCGYSFCQRCVRWEIEVPRQKNSIQKVCAKCYEKLSVDKMTTSVYIPGDVKHLIDTNDIFRITDAAMQDDPVLEPVPVAPSASLGVSEKASNSREICDNLDEEISHRLQALKTIPKESELQKRLHILQDYKPQEYIKRTEKVSTGKQIDNLIEQIEDETRIEKGASFNAISDIERRLALLRADDIVTTLDRTKPDPNTPSDNEDNDDVLVANIMQRYVDEARLPDMSSVLDHVSIDGTEKSINVKAGAETEELPWCTICNEDATVRCVTCGGDLFCRSCFKECHLDDEEWRNHSTQPYSKPPNFKEDHFS